jgi:hypothetical protein
MSQHFLKGLRRTVGTQGTTFCRLWLPLKNKAALTTSNSPGVAQTVAGALGYQISWHSAHEGGEVVSRTQRPPLPLGIFLVLIFTRGWIDPRDVIRSKGNISLKNPVTLPGIDPGTVRPVAQRLNHYVTPGPKIAVCGLIFTLSVSDALRGTKGLS